MQWSARQSIRRTLATLHPVFALTGVIHAIGGSLLPSLAFTFHLSDSQSGMLFFLYFAGSSLGALLCVRSYARTIALGFLAVGACCAAVTVVHWPLLLLVFALLGISVGVPMSAVSLFVGRNFADRCAPVLTFLNFTWSAGALLAPLLAGWILLRHTYRAAYVILAFAAAIAAMSCFLLLGDAPESSQEAAQRRDATSLRLIAVFACAAFLQVGVENTSAAWLSTFALRTSGTSVAVAAATTSLYWIGFLGSRGMASLLLLRVWPMRMLRIAAWIALGAALLLAAAPSVALRSVAMFLLGVALAPVYPLVIAGSLVRAPHTSDSRWVLAAAGFGGSVLPWTAGWISAHTSDLRIGMLTIPAALLLMILLLPMLSGEPRATLGGQKTT
jgi:FHS family glucose/mannose:H+ symporter-like MFS transporter